MLSKNNVEIAILYARFITFIDRNTFKTKQKKKEAVILLPSGRLKKMKIIWVDEEENKDVEIDNSI
jgi:hypothetical protein